MGRPDLLSSVINLSQVTEANYTRENVRATNKVLKRAHMASQNGLPYPAADPETVHLARYSDVSFTTNEDGSSQLRFIVLLVERTEKSSVLSFPIREYKQVVRSLLRAESFAFDGVVGEALLLRHNLRILLRTYVPLKALTDSSSPFSIRIIIWSITTT